MMGYVNFKGPELTMDVEELEMTRRRSLCSYRWSAVPELTVVPWYLLIRGVWTVKPLS
jgi:hypothetical protein